MLDTFLMQQEVQKWSSELQNALGDPDPFYLLALHSQKIGSLVVTRWLLHLQALCPSSRQEKGKKQRRKGTCQLGLSLFIRKRITFL